MSKLIFGFLFLCSSLCAREYPIKEICRVIDGDTVDVVIDLGFGITIRERLRLYGINAWEVRGDERPQGIKAKEFLIMQLSEAQNISINVPEKERGKYGRVLATIYADGIDLNQMLVDGGHAELILY